MTQENNTSKKKWVTPRKLGLSGKKTKAGNTNWLPEGMTYITSTCSTNNHPHHYGNSTYHTTTTRNCFTNVSTGQS